MIFSAAGDLLIFSVTLLGGGAALAPCFRPFSGPARLALGIGSAIVVFYLCCFTRYWLHLPDGVLWVPVLAGAVGMLYQRRAVAELACDRAVRQACGHWLILALWCLGWQMLVVSYSGSAWSGDWLEHYDRTFFFLRHWPLDQLFLDMYPLPARPPLANLVISGWLGLTSGRFFHFQVFSTLLATLTIFPLAGMVDRLRPGAAAQAVLLLLLLASPLLVQNATFPWTKLPAAYFIILAADLLSHDPATFRPVNLQLALPALAAGMLVHYSAAIWVVALALAWLLTQRALLADPAIRRSLLLGATIATLLFSTWLGWSLAAYGPGVTFTANSSSGLAPAMTIAERASHSLSNVYRTLVPTWLWEGMPAQVQQDSTLARFRDRWFCLYQLNLPFAFGIGGLLVLGRTLLLSRREDNPIRRFWFAAAILLIAINAGAHATAEPLGLTHISLQPLVLLGLAWLAAQAGNLPAPWVRLWMLAAVVDFILGIALQFGVESFWLNRWLDPGRSDLDLARQLSQPAAANYFGILRTGVQFLATRIPPFVALLLLGTAAVLAGFAFRSALKNPVAQPAGRGAAGLR